MEKVEKVAVKATVKTFFVAKNPISNLILFFESKGD